MITPEEFTLLQNRLAQLEKRTRGLRRERWFWRCGFLITLGIVAYVIVLEAGGHALPTPKTVNCDTVNCQYVVTQGVMLNTSEGKRRAVLGTDDKGVATLSFWMPEEQLVAAIGGYEKGGWARFFDRERKADVWVGVYTGGEPGFHIQDAKGVHRVQLILMPNGSFFSLRNEAGVVTFSKP